MFGNVRHKYAGICIHNSHSSGPHLKSLRSTFSKCAFAYLRIDDFGGTASHRRCYGSVDRGGNCEGGPTYALLIVVRHAIQMIERGAIAVKRAIEVRNRIRDGGIMPENDLRDLSEHIDGALLGFQIAS